MRRLKILHLIDLEKVGGVESMFVDFIQATPPKGITAEHYTIVDSLDLAPRFVEPVRRCSRLLATPRRWLGFKLPRRPRGIRQWRRMQLIRQVKPDLVLAWNQFTDLGSSGLQLGCPLIYYEHGMSWYTHSQRQLDSFLPHVHGAIAASHAAARMLQLKHGVPFDIRECPNPLRRGMSSAAIEPKARNPLRPLRIGIAGRLVPLKAVPLVVLAVKHLLARGIAAEAVIAGEGPEKGVLETLIRREGLEPHVRLLGLVDDMPAFYRDIDVFVSTSMHETMPLVCLEAMAYGVPVIASRVDGFPEIVRSGYNGLLLDPKLGVHEYGVLTGASTSFSNTVYAPDLDALIPTALLSPEQIADAVVCIAANNDEYKKFSTAALSSLAEVRDYSQYLDGLYGCLLDYLN